MPPRHAYWTILVDEQPTAFRAADRDDLQPTFKRLQEKHPSARMVWFQNGKIWGSRLEAQEAMKLRGQRGRAGDFRQRETLSERRPAGTAGLPESKGRAGDFRQRQEQRPAGKLEWKPKGTFVQPEADRRSAKREAGKLEWKPKGTFDPAEGRPIRRSAKREGGPVPRSAKREGGKLEWRPKSHTPGTKAPEKRKWVPKEEYKKSQGSKPQARDKKWRPGGEHRDPRQKYKDAKKAKWTRFKQTIRKRWEPKREPKKKDEE